LRPKTLLVSDQQRIIELNKKAPRDGDAY